MLAVGLEVGEEEIDDDFFEGNDLFNPSFNHLVGLLERQGLLGDEEEVEEAFYRT